MLSATKTSSHEFRFKQDINDPSGGVFFLARAASGKVQQIPGHPVSGQQDRKTCDDGYHSVRGDVKGPGRAYAFYKPNTVFPQYLVTYTANIN